MSAKSKLKSAKKTAQNNPATTTGSVGAVVAILGRYLGWDEQLQLDIVTLFLVAVPTVRGIVIWWQNRTEADAPAEDEATPDA